MVPFSLLLDYLRTILTASEHAAIVSSESEETRGRVMPAKTMSSNEARSNWHQLLEGALTGDCDTIIERYGQPIEALIPFDDYIAVLETLEDLRLARQALPALEEWQADPDGNCSPNWTSIQVAHSRRPVILLRRIPPINRPHARRYERGVV